MRGIKFLQFKIKKNTTQEKLDPSWCLIDMGLIWIYVGLFSIEVWITCTIKIINITIFWLKLLNKKKLTNTYNLFVVDFKQISQNS